jgi:hypothetical protein
MVSAGLCARECALDIVKNKQCTTILIMEGEVVSVFV